MASAIKQSEHQQLLELQERLKEAEDTLDAIRRGAVDALVVSGPNDREIYTLQSADYTYRMLIESMNQGALTISLDGTVLYSNRQFSEMLNIPLERIIGADILSFVVPRDRTLLTPYLGADHHTDLKVELNLQAAQSKQLTVITSATTVHQPGVNPYLCVVITDLTERKQAEDAKDEFISLASHQLRTPATSVKQYINMLIDGLLGELTDAQISALQNANMSNERELRIIEDLLKVAQVDAGKIILSRRQINMNDLLERLVSEQALKVAERRQKVTYIPPPRPITAYVDEYVMYMTLENLFDNASKYMAEGGTITIACQEIEDEVTISITDEGVGIKKADIPKLFQKFSRLPNELSVQVGGNGLGLYWVKKVMDLHNARIDVRSKIGKGTTFLITLPSREEADV
jgi:PAS domain S-box-containing protein